ncbi:dihydropteroate synthase [Phenylobacterium sp.]|uniref:dihydropteroate synthase n=1 Tax=Phenylobacterium sp. TaxID=1871053 RepID=UPI00286BC40D|nr:dihydropteroate synthase [Phenylobacterium sp.]
MARIMGVVNLTPDSFSDGGRFLAPDAALAGALAMIREGADILDVGAESTRPGAEPVSADDEIARLVPLIEAVRAQSDIAISVDTMKPDVARAAVGAGADIWNDVTALSFSPEAPAVAAELGCEVVLMHMQGRPGTMQANPRYDDVTAEVTAFLTERSETAMAAGVSREKIWLDPGIGFGKRLEHNLALLAHLDAVVALGFPVLLGVSRKRFIAALEPAAEPASARLPGSLAAALAGVAAGVAVVRVHDVAATVQALKVQAAIAAARGQTS